VELGATATQTGALLGGLPVVEALLVPKHSMLRLLEEFLSGRWPYTGSGGNQEMLHEMHAANSTNDIGHFIVRV